MTWHSQQRVPVNPEHTAQHIMRSVFRTYMYRVRSALTLYFFTYIYMDRAQRFSVDVWSGICQNVLVCMYLENRPELTVSISGIMFPCYFLYEQVVKYCAMVYFILFFCSLHDSYTYLWWEYQGNTVSKLCWSLSRPSFLL